MSEAQTDFLDADLLHDADATNQHPAVSSPPDELKTTRLPSITPPPMPVAHVAPQPVTLPPVAVPPFTSSMPVMQELPRATPGPRPSWLQALLQSTPPTRDASHGSRAPVSAQAAGTTFAVMGLVFALVALVTGLRGVPDETTVAPLVSAAVVIARALIALGAGALSFGMFREAERLLVGRETPPKS